MCQVMFSKFSLKKYSLLSCLVSYCLPNIKMPVHSGNSALRYMSRISKLGTQPPQPRNNPGVRIPCRQHMHKCVIALGARPVAAAVFVASAVGLCKYTALGRHWML